MGEGEVRIQLHLKVVYAQVNDDLKSQCMYAHIYEFCSYSEIPCFSKALILIHFCSSYACYFQ